MARPTTSRAVSGSSVAGSNPGTAHPVALVFADGSRKELAVREAELIEMVLEGNEQTLSPAEAARILGVSRPMVVRWIQEERLPDSMVGTHHRIPLAAVIEFKAQRLATSKAALADLGAAAEGDHEAERRVALARHAASAMVADLYP